jgi:hypothetical protein
LSLLDLSLLDLSLLELSLLEPLLLDISLLEEPPRIKVASAVLATKTSNKHNAIRAGAILDDYFFVFVIEY